MKDLKVKDLYGLPVVNEKIVKSLKEKKIAIVMGIEALWDTKTSGKTVVIDQFGKLAACGIPILGYHRTAIGVWRKIPRSMPPNEVVVTYPIYIGAPNPIRKENGPEVDLDLLLELHQCKDYKKLAKKYAEHIDDPKERKFKWFRRAVLDKVKKEGEVSDSDIKDTKPSKTSKSKEKPKPAKAKSKKGAK